MLEHPRPAVGIRHGRDVGSALAIDHLDRRAIRSRLRTDVSGKLLLEGLTAEAFADPLGLRIHDTLRQQQPVGLLRDGIPGCLFRHETEGIPAVVRVSEHPEIEVERRPPAMRRPRH